MHKKFLGFANDMKNKSLLDTDSFFLVNRSKWHSVFAKHFIEICEKIKILQEERIISKISLMQYTMLYTNFVNRNYIAEIWVYGNENFLDKKAKDGWGI